jgi:hypothetical protein
MNITDLLVLDIHPYIKSFCILRPEFLEAKWGVWWPAVSDTLMKLDEMEVGLDSVCILQPLLLDACGPTITAVFWEHVQQHLALPYTSADVFEENWDRLPRKRESCVMLLEECLWQIEQFALDNDQPPAEKEKALKHVFSCIGSWIDDTKCGEELKNRVSLHVLKDKMKE